MFHLRSCFYIIFTGLVLNVYSLILSFSNLKVEQHLAGKNHTRLASGLPGLKPGYFNKATSKWERSPPEENQETPTPAPTPSLPSTSLGSKVANEHNFYCQLCKVTCCQFICYAENLKYFSRWEHHLKPRWTCTSTGRTTR